MILFAATGSWGEISPLLSLAIQFRGKLACGPEWVGLASHYDVPLAVIGRRMALDSTVKGFMAALDMDALMRDLWYASQDCSAIVSSFFLWPAQIVAELRGIPYIATTTSEYYFAQGQVIEKEFLDARRETLNAIRERCKLKRVDDPLTPKEVIALYPEFMGGIGYPRLPSLGTKYPEGDYCLVSSGTVNPQWENDALMACDLLGLRCEYLKNFRMDLNHAEAMRHAKAAIIHGGVGTLVDAVSAKVPVIVRPIAYDQKWNAAQLKKYGAGLWPALKPGIVDAEIESDDVVFARIDTCLKTHGLN